MAPGASVREGGGSVCTLFLVFDEWEVRIEREKLWDIRVYLFLRKEKNYGAQEDFDHCAVSDDVSRLDQP